MQARETGIGRGNFKKKQAGKSTLLALVTDEKEGVLKVKGLKFVLDQSQNNCSGFENSIIN